METGREDLSPNQRASQILNASLRIQRSFTDKNRNTNEDFCILTRLPKIKHFLTSSAEKQQWAGSQHGCGMDATPFGEHPDL